METFLLSVITCLLLATLGSCIPTLSGFPTDCGKPKVTRLSKEETMYSKTEATPHSWPWHVGLWSKSRGEHPFCGGTLISEKLVLTSARCLRSLITCANMTAGETFKFSNLTGDTLIAHLGDHKFTKPENTLQAIEVDLIQVHPNFKDKDDGASVDVALLQLSKAITKSKEVDYICVPSADLGLSPEKSCYYAGWGAVLRQGKEKQWRNSRLLREAEVYVASNQECSTAGLPFTAEKSTCIEVEARSPCHGDAGGGLYCQPEKEGPWFLNGVLSNGDDKCLAERAITTSVTSFTTWLSDNTSLKVKETPTV